MEYPYILIVDCIELLVNFVEYRILAQISLIKRSYSTLYYQRKSFKLNANVKQNKLLSLFAHTDINKILSLDIEKNNRINDVNFFRHLTKLYIDRHSHIHDISKLTELKKLKIGYFITTIDNLRKLENLTIHGSDDTITHINNLNVTQLKLIRKEKFDISSLINLQKLKIKRLCRFNFCQKICNFTYLKIRACSGHTKCKEYGGRNRHVHNEIINSTSIGLLNAHVRYISFKFDIDLEVFKLTNLHCLILKNIKKNIVICDLINLTRLVIKKCFNAELALNLFNLLELNLDKTKECIHVNFYTSITKLVLKNNVNISGMNELISLKELYFQTEDLDSMIKLNALFDIKFLNVKYENMKSLQKISIINKEGKIIALKCGDMIGMQ